MNLISILILSLSATSDSFVIGFHFGVRGVRIGRVSNLYISLVCLLGTCLSMLAGSRMGSVLPEIAASLLSALILLSLGLWMLRGTVRRGRSGEYPADPETVDRDASKTVELRESFSIGVMLALNNCGIGIGAGMAGLPVLFTSALCAAMSFFFIGLGSLLGKSFSPGLPALALEAGAAVILVGLGLAKLLAL